MVINRHVWLRGGALVLGGVVALAGYQLSESDDTPVQSAAASAPQRNPMEIVASDFVMEHVKVGEPGWENVSGSLSVPARVEVDATRMTRVGAPITGRITELLVQEGQMVERGEVLARVYSADLSDTQLKFLKAYSNQQLAKRAVERARVLVQADVIGSAELQRREAELAQASAEMSAARDQLAVLGMSERDIERLEESKTVNSVTQIVASMSGTILKRNVTVGQVVQPADTVFEIADLSEVWLVADVPEQSAGALQKGQLVEAEIPALPGDTITGRLSFVSATVNPDTRTIFVRMNLRNPQQRYKPAMLARMTLKDQATRRPVIPSTAVVREEDREHIFVQIDKNTFVLREVELGPEFDNKRVLIEGLNPGEKIVVDGAFHLNNERKRIEVTS